MELTSIPATRICTICLQEKNLETDFRRQSNGKYGRQSACRPCVKTALAAYRKTPKGKAKYREYAKRHREKPGYKEKHRSYRESPKGIWRLYQKGAEKRGLPFDLTLEYLIENLWQKPCSYCGCAIATAGLDRVNNAGGYTVSNTVPCCSTCNFMKLKSSRQDFIMKCRQIAIHTARIVDPY